MRNATVIAGMIYRNGWAAALPRTGATALEWRTLMTEEIVGAVICILAVAAYCITSTAWPLIGIVIICAILT
jgi:hypothetical protein